MGYNFFKSEMFYLIFSHLCAKGWNCSAKYRAFSTLIPCFKKSYGRKVMYEINFLEKLRVKILMCTCAHVCCACRNKIPHYVQMVDIKCIS